MKTSVIIIAGIYMSVSMGCHRVPGTRVTVRVQSGHGQKLYLSPVPYAGEKGGIIDSALVEDMTRDIVFELPAEEHLYQLGFAQSGVKFIFINDGPELSIAGNYLTGKYKVQGSVASDELCRFLDRQLLLAKRTRVLAQMIDEKKGEREPLQKVLDSSFIVLERGYRSFADTVRSPAAFLAVYNTIEFGKDYAGESAFIKAAAARFPSSKPIRELREGVLAYIKVMQEEYQVGDRLPDITLPDRDGFSFSTGSLKGKYYLIDFWSTWCPQCVAYNKAKLALRRSVVSDSFEIVSVAIDAEKEDWKNSIRSADWPQLIDTQMWQGVAVRTLKFDSIPFNFLVDPGGRIIRKALPPDSLAGAVRNALLGGR